MGSRAATAAVSVVASLALSVLLWWYFDTLLLFLLVPFVPFLFRGQRDRRVRECPRCQFETTSPEYEFCPRDGERLRERRDDTDDRW